MKKNKKISQNVSQKYLRSGEEKPQAATGEFGNLSSTAVNIIRTDGVMWPASKSGENFWELRSWQLAAFWLSENDGDC